MLINLQTRPTLKSNTEVQQDKESDTKEVEIEEENEKGTGNSTDARELKRSSK